MINILHVFSSATVGGAERLFLSIFDRHNSGLFNYRVVMIARESQGSLIPELERRNIPFTNLYNVYRGPLGVLRCVIQVGRLIRKHDIRIVHTYGVTAAVLSRMIAKLCGAKVVDGMHGDMGDFRTRASIILDKATAFCVDAWLASSQYALDAGIRRGIVRPRRGLVVRNGIDAASIQSKTRDLPGGDRLNIIVVANLHLYKGHRYVVDAVRTMPPALRKKIRIIFIGRDEFNGTIQAQIAQYGLEDTIAWKGFQRDVVGLLRKSDIFLLPSETESLPMSILEAMSVGLPVIATRVGGIPEAVNDGVTGVIIPPRDPESITHAVQRFILPSGEPDYERIAQYGGAGRQRVLEEFSLEKMADEMEKSYQRVLAE